MPLPAVIGCVVFSLWGGDSLVQTILSPKGKDLALGCYLLLSDFKKWEGLSDS